MVAAWMRDPIRDDASEDLAAASCRTHAAPVRSSRSCSRRSPYFVPSRWAADRARRPRASSETPPGTSRSAFRTKAPNWLCASETAPPAPGPRSCSERLRRSASGQSARADSTTWLAHRSQALPTKSLRRASAIRMRCAGACSSMHCRTKWAKGCRQSSSASASTSPRRQSSSAEALECSMSRQRMRQPKRWRATCPPTPTSSLTRKVDMTVGRAATIVWST
mmetsp:Transcript_39000/g.112606  ORF Transcript_39000/g.112606 Transcript_39000/m.112606 type:complete len:222 (+) Transcript_39000:187-852(+)